MLKRKNFLRKKEDFICKNCGAKIKGDGYTDHCPICLWGKHVDDVVPGDRASDCKGMMEPTRVIFEKSKYRIEYKCQKCGHEFRVWADKEDNRDRLLELVTN